MGATPPGYDAIVIGAGPAGLTAALEAAATGARVLVVEKRNAADSAQRFQAVVLDAQSQINLRNLGVELDDLVALHQALILDGEWRVDGHVRYAEQPVPHHKPSSSALDGILDRREISSVCAIRDLEAALLRACHRHTHVEVINDCHVSHITPSEYGNQITFTAAGRSTSAFGALLAICDGAASDQSGALRLLRTTKIPLAAPVGTLICRFDRPAHPGIVRIRTQVARYNNMVVSFDLRHEQIIYAGYPQTGYDPSFLAADLAREMKLPGQLLQAPLVVSQQTRIASEFCPASRVLVLGDAALCGTAPLGVYLNKAIADARYFGETCAARHNDLALRTRIQGYARRRTHPKIAQLIWEESMVAWLFNHLHTLPRAMQLHAVAELLPRYAFRWKVKRGGITRMFAVNAIDTSATALSTLSSAAHQARLGPLANLMAASARACRHAQDFME